MLFKISEREKVSNVLHRLSQVMRHFPETVVSNYDRKMVTNLPDDIEQRWQTKIRKMYNDRKCIFHEGKIERSGDFLKLFGTPTETGDVGLLEAVLGRILPFIAKGSLKFSTLREIWDNVSSYKSEKEVNPITNLGGWIQGWVH